VSARFARCWQPACLIAAELRIQWSPEALPVSAAIAGSLCVVTRVASALVVLTKVVGALAVGAQVVVEVPAAVRPLAVVVVVVRAAEVVGAAVRAVLGVQAPASLSAVELAQQPERAVLSAALPPELVQTQGQFSLLLVDRLSVAPCDRSS
jgi:hypothetical protein